MAIQGDLKDMGFAELLQLLAAQNQNGCLSIKRKKPKAVIKLLFEGGLLVGLFSTPQRSGRRLGERLVATDTVPSASIKEAIKTQRKSNLRLGDILIAAGATDVQTVSRMVRVQAKDVLLGLFEDLDGQYEFRARPIDQGEKTLAPMSVEQVMLDGMRALDEWPLIRSRVNNHSVVYRHHRSLTTRGVSGSMSGSLDEVSQSVHGLVDGTRNVDELIACGGFGEFETCRAISILHSQGYIGPIKVKAPQERPGTSDGGQFRRWGLFVVVNAGILLSLAWANQSIDLSSHDAREAACRVANGWTDLQRQDLLGAARRSLEEHRLEFGHYPSELRGALAKGLMRADLFAALKKSGYEYVSIGSHYELH